MADKRYSPAERAREKEAARERDEQLLAEGALTPAQLQEQNTLLAFPGARVKFRRR